MSSGAVFGVADWLLAAARRVRLVCSPSFFPVAPGRAADAPPSFGVPPPSSDASVCPFSLSDGSNSKTSTRINELLKRLGLDLRRAR
jgi:hypothetical protein